MKVFNSFKNPSLHQSKKSGKAKAAPRPNLSESDIRERLAKGLGKNGNNAANPNIKKGRQVSEFMSGKPAKFIEHPNPMKAEEAQKKAEDLMLKSDVGANDPNNPETIGKLKNVLSMGTFNFSDKEKSALSKILGMGKNG